MDRIDTLNQRLNEVLVEYKALRKVGISEDILLTYLKQKTKLKEKEIKQMFQSLDDFYKGILNEELIKKLD